MTPEEADYLYRLAMNTALSGDLSDLVAWAETQGRRELFAEQEPPLLDLVADAYERGDWSDLEAWCHHHLGPVLDLRRREAQALIAAAFEQLSAEGQAKDTDAPRRR
jgi:hypothetical protein